MVPLVLFDTKIVPACAPLAAASSAPNNNLKLVLLGISMLASQDRSIRQVASMATKSLGSASLGTVPVRIRASPNVRHTPLQQILRPLRILAREKNQSPRLEM